MRETFSRATASSRDDTGRFLPRTTMSIRSPPHEDVWTSLRPRWWRCPGRGERDDAPCAAVAQRPRRGREGGAGRGDVVDDEHRRRRDAPDDVGGTATPVGAGATGLRWPGPAVEQPEAARVEPPGHGASEQLSGVEPARPPAVA